MAAVPLLKCVSCQSNVLLVLILSRHSTFIYHILGLAASLEYAIFTAASAVAASLGQLFCSARHLSVVAICYIYIVVVALCYIYIVIEVTMSIA